MFLVTGDEPFIVLKSRMIKVWTLDRPLWGPFRWAGLVQKSDLEQVLWFFTCQAPVFRFQTGAKPSTKLKLGQPVLFIFF